MDLEKYKKAASDAAAAKEAAAVATKAEEEARQKQDTERSAAEGEAKFKELQQERAGVEQQLEAVGTDMAKAKQKIEEATAFAESSTKELDDATRAEFERDFNILKTELASLEYRAGNLRSRKEALDANISGAEAAKAVGETLHELATDDERRAAEYLKTLPRYDDLKQKYIQKNPGDADFAALRIATEELSKVMWDKMSERVEISKSSPEQGRRIHEIWAKELIALAKDLTGPQSIAAEFEGQGNNVLGSEAIKTAEGLMKTGGDPRDLLKTMKDLFSEFEKNFPDEAKNQKERIRNFRSGLGDNYRKAIDKLIAEAGI